MEAIPVFDSTHLVPLEDGRALMVGAPPEALKVLTHRGLACPSAVLLPPDPLYADGLNQASIEFLIFNHLFRLQGLRDRLPFCVVCDAEQKPRIEELVRHILRGPSEEEMAAWRTPPGHRRQLLQETTFVSGETARLDLEEMVRVLAFEEGRAVLPTGETIEQVEAGAVRVAGRSGSVCVPRRAQRRTELPLYFAQVDTPLRGPRFGLQVIGSASGFSATEWGSCFIVWVNGQPLVVDGTPYLADHLRLLGIEDDHLLGYLITHTHEDHANILGQLVGRRPATVLTSGPVMASLVGRMAAILGIPREEVRRLFRWVPLEPGLEGFGEPLSWFGAEIRAWYSVHTIPTLGVDISMEGRSIRMPGDTLWGRQLEPLLEQGIITPERYRFILHTYDGADVIVADAGGGPVHPDPQEVQELLAHRNGSRLFVTHLSDPGSTRLPTAEPGTAIELIPRSERTPEEAMALFASPLLEGLPERWLLALLYGGEVATLEEEAGVPGDDAVVVLLGSLRVRESNGKASAAEPLYLQRGDLFQRELAPELVSPRLVPAARWTRILRIPAGLYRAFVSETGIEPRLRKFYRTRRWWRFLAEQDLGLDTAVALSALCRERTFPAGTEIVTQGERGGRFYLVTRGRVEVIRRDGETRVVGRFGPGYHFGEVALMGGEPRIATVRAVQETAVLELPEVAFRQHLLRIPLARYELRRIAARRLAELLAPSSPAPLPLAGRRRAALRG